MFFQYADLRFVVSLGSSRNAPPHGGGGAAHCKKHLLAVGVTKCPAFANAFNNRLENHSSSFDKVARIHRKRCKCVTNHWETLQCISNYSNVFNDA